MSPEILSFRSLVMALLWIEGFEGFGTSVGNAPSPSGIVGRKYPVIQNEVSMDLRDGRLGGYSLQFTSASTYMQSPALTTNSTFIIGLSAKFTLSSVDRALFYLYDGATVGMTLLITATGEISIWRGGTALGTTSGLGLISGAWYYIEFKVVCGNSPNGSYEVRVGGVNVLDDTGLDTQAGTHAYHDRFRLNNSVTDPLYPYFDDLYCLDGSGASNNDFLGNMRVADIRPNSDTAAKAWTRSAGSDNYALANEVVIDDDTTYIESGVSTTKDLYDYESVLGLGDSVKGIQINTVCRETDANSFSLITVVKSDVDESDDSAQAIGTTSYVTKTRLVETDPHTSNAWTLAGLNAAQFGIKVG